MSRIWPIPDDLPHAAGRGDAEAVSRRFAAGPPELDRAFAWSVQSGHYRVADYLLERGIDLDTRWSKHEPASDLHECVFVGHTEQVAYLVGKGISLETRDHRYGATAEGWARYADKDEIAEFLAARGSG